jgi:hypothetical protein
MKRLLTLAAFLFGGLATELMHPVQCLLLTPAATAVKRKRT